MGVTQKYIPDASYPCVSCCGNNHHKPNCLFWYDNTWLCQDCINRNIDWGFDGSGELDGDEDGQDKARMRIWKESFEGTLKKYIEGGI